MALRMNPFTGKPEFIDEAPVVNEQTGQKANTAGQTAVAQVSPRNPTATNSLVNPNQAFVNPNQTFQNAPAPFNPPKERVVRANELSEDFGTKDFDDFRDEADFSAQGAFSEHLEEQKRLQAQSLQFAETSPELDSALADLNRVREDRDQLLDFSEDRQVDIGTIRGEQASTNREFARREQTAINKANLLLNRQAQQISATEMAMQFNQQNLDTVMKLHELTSPEIIGQEIDPVTGEVIAFKQNFDGTITQEIIGKISIPDPEKKTIGIVTNKATNQQILISEKDGVMITEAIEGTAGKEALSESDNLRNQLLRQQIKNAEAENADVVIAKEQKKAQAVQKAQSIFTAANELLNNQEWLDALTGVSALASHVPGTVGYTAKTKLDEVTNLLTLDNLGLMTGVLTDKDIEILTGAATSLKSGIDRAVFVEELTQLKDAAGGTIQDSVSPSTQAAAFGISTDEQDEIDFILLGGDIDVSTDYSNYYPGQQ